MISDYRTPLPDFVTVFFREMDTHPEEYGEDIWRLRKLIDQAFQKEDLLVDEKLAEDYLSLQKYFPFKLLPYQICALCLWACVYDPKTDLPRWPTLFVMGARGLGKDGIIAFASFMLTSPYNPSSNYDIDICANNEEQAVRPLKDVLEVLENPKFSTLLKKFYYWTKEVVKGRENGGEIKGRTNNPKGRDGMRSGCIVFNELHEYQNYKNIEVFRTGLGKKKHPRTLYVTTNGYVVGGPLDDYLSRCDKILKGETKDNGWLPFIFRLTNEKDILDESKWYQANPRLKYSPELLYEYREEFEDYKLDPDKNTSFATKRMNFRKVNTEVHVTKWENILKTNQNIPDLKGHECVIGIDYAKTNDWIAVNAHFKQGDERYDICHAFVCVNGEDFPKLTCPHEDWNAEGLITYVDAPEVSPSVVRDYIQSLMKQYRVKSVAIDSFRFTLLSEALADLGFTLKNKNLKTIRPSDQMKIAPVIDSCFNNSYFHWGDNPMLRWATNNTKLVRSSPSKLAIEGNIDNGNFQYGKIERHKRKTDPFMALVMSMCLEDQLTGFRPTKARSRIGVITV